MLRNSTVGTKLLAVILPPLLVLVGITSYGVKDRLDVSQRAQDASFAVSMLWAGRQLTSELQLERMWTALLIQGQPVANQLGEQQTVTDRSWTLYLTLANQVSDDVVYRPMVDRSVVALRDLQTVRSSIRDASRDLYGAFEWYGTAISQIIAVGTGAVGAVPSARASLDLNTYVSFALTQEAYAKRALAHLAAQGSGSFDAPGRLWRLERAANNRAFQLEQLIFTSANPDQVEAYNELLNSGAMNLAIEYQDGIFELIRPTVNQGDGTLIGEAVQLTPELVASVAPSGTDITVTPEKYLDITYTGLDVLSGFGSLVLTSVDSSVHDNYNEARNTAWAFIIIAIVGILFSAILAFVLTRRLTAPLRKLSKDAKALAEVQLPEILEQITSPQGLPESFELQSLSSGQRDELGQLANSFDHLQQAMLQVAKDQSTLLHRGISDLFVNIARRNQSLIDRQIEFIDALEAQERDPKLLESLYTLDHLATQIRRNDESLLVLAGVETGLRRSRPVELHHVIRMAMGEIKDYQRVNLVNVESVQILGNAASNVAHILAELLENATTFSPPESDVEVGGAALENGTYVITITDHGIGITQDQINELNTLLEEPPLVGLSMSRNLGLAIAARLAHRLEATVVLSSTATGGVQAAVTLPKSILPPPGNLADGALPPRAFLPLASSVESQAEAPIAKIPAKATTKSDRPSEPVVEAPILPSSTQVTQSDEPRYTSAGLVRRVPLAERQARAESVGILIEPPTTVSKNPVDFSSSPVQQEGHNVGAPKRSPEEVREMLSRYRSGLRKGQSATNKGEINRGPKEDL